MSILNECLGVFFIVPTKEEEEVVEEMETSTALEEDNIPVISRSFKFWNPSFKLMVIKPFTSISNLGAYNYQTWATLLHHTWNQTSKRVENTFYHYNNYANSIFDDKIGSVWKVVSVIKLVYEHPLNQKIQ